MVPVEVAQDDGIDVLRGETEGEEIFGKVPRPLCPEYLSLLFGQLVSDAGVDEHQGIGRFHQYRTGKMRDIVLFVARIFPLPESLRHDSEHGAAL